MENNTNNPEVSKNNNIEYLAEKFNRDIIRKNVHAHLPPKSIMNGAEIPYFHGFNDHGPNKDLSAGYFSFLGEILMRDREIFPELANSHFLCIKEEPNKKNKILAIVSLQDKKIDARGHNPTYVLFELPNKKADELVEEVKKEPDLLEKLYQKAFDGLESKNENPGLRRVKAKAFYLMPEKDRRELSLIFENRYEMGFNNGLRKMKEFFNNLEKYTYKKGPYGSGEVYRLDND